MAPKLETMTIFLILAGIFSWFSLNRLTSLKRFKYDGHIHYNNAGYYPSMLCFNVYKTQKLVSLINQFIC